jgi:hypothetical protein
VNALLSMDVLVGPSVYYLTPGSRLYEESGVPDEIKDDWDMYRSSAFAVETDRLTRADLVNLFLSIRRKNLEKRAGSA